MPPVIGVYIYFTIFGADRWWAAPTLLCQRQRCEVDVGEAEAFVDEIDELFAGKVAAEVFAEEGGHVVGTGGGLAADVRGDDDVRLLPEAVVRRERFGFGDVDAGAGDVAGFEGVDQVIGDDERSAGDVDDEGILWQECQPAGVDHVASVVGERSREDEDVDLGEDLVDGVGGVHLVDLGWLGAGPPVGADNFAVERAEHLGEPAAVAAETDDANAGAMQVAGGPADEFAFLLGTEVDGEAAQEGRCEGDGMVGDLVGEDARGAGDGDRGFDDRGDQHMVEPGGGRLDPVEPLAAADFVPRDWNFGMAAKNVGVEQFFSDVLLAGIDDIVVGGRGGDLGDVPGLDRVAENDSFSTGGGTVTNRWRLWLDWHSIGCCQPRNSWQVQAGRI